MHPEERGYVFGFKIKSSKGKCRMVLFQQDRDGLKENKGCRGDTH